MTTARVVRTITRPSPATVEALAGAGVATAHEAMGRSGLLRPYLRPVQRGTAIAGPAVTALCAPGDNLMIHAAIETCERGDVLVVAVSSESTDGMFGELLATSLQARGVAGLIIDAGVRDVAALTEMGFPVWSKAISAQGTVKATAGSVNVPVVCAGALVCPGDVIVADDDGVVCVPEEHAEGTVTACRGRLDRETESRRRLAAGELGLDLYGLRERLAQLGVVYEDGPTVPSVGPRTTAKEQLA
jgi:4-hydroxy-4-methyl-2-oxoglutarate aldolase